MNYFGHAVLAHRYRPEPTFVLGAMLPDLIHLTDEPLGDLGDPALASGIAFHHRTDALFHATPSFVGLCRDALAAVRAAGVRKGPARGMTHLVVELLIDAQLAEEEAARAAYMDALACRPKSLLARPRLVEGLDWLVSRGPGLHNSTKERLARALGVALRGRPKLEPSAEELEVALTVWHDLDTRVRAEVPTLLFDLASLAHDPVSDGVQSPRDPFFEPPHARPVTFLR